ncbi:hypothetical protein X777_01371, partial [Ooceraea biroi]
NISSQAKLNEIVDRLLPRIRSFILENGMDPTDLIDFSESIFPLLPGILKGNIDFKNGWLQNLSQLKRAGSVTGEYKDKLFMLNMNFGFDVLDFNYEYYLTYMLYKRQGDVNGRFYNLDVNVVITIDLTNYHLSLESIKFSKVRKYDIKFEGNILDVILNALTKVVTLFFRTYILTGIENRSMMILNAKIDEWNKNFPRPNRTEVIENWLNMKTDFY